MIHHLSYPKGASINDSIPPEFSSVKYASVDGAISLIQRKSKGCAMAKTDVRSAFRIVLVASMAIPVGKWVGFVCFICFISFYYFNYYFFPCR